LLVKTKGRHWNECKKQATLTSPILNSLIGSQSQT
jgi:hypothetical protein